MSLSPSKSAEQRGDSLNRARNKIKLFGNTREFICRRLQRKTERNSGDCAQEIREGGSYESNIGLSNEVPDTNTIPPPPPLPIIQEPDPDVKVAEFNLETTGLAHTSSTTQIAAVCGDETFSGYVIPNELILTGASDVTKLTFVDGNMFYNKSLLPKIALSNFISKFINPILIGHNVTSFDTLYNELKSLNMWPHFDIIVSAFSDKLPYFKIIFIKLTSYSQCNLVTHIFGDKYLVPSALEDTTSLQTLVMFNIENSVLFSNNFTPEGLEISVCNGKLNRKLFQNLGYPLIQICNLQDVGMWNKIVSSGFNLNYLKLAYNRNGFDGVFSIFKRRFQRKTMCNQARNVVLWEGFKLTIK